MSDTLDLVINEIISAIHANCIYYETCIAEQSHD